METITCKKCFLIECCCEADRLQVIADDERAKKEGYTEINGRWVKKENYIEINGQWIKKEGYIEINGRWIKNKKMLK